MKLDLSTRPRKFFQTTLLGGLAAILPITILFLVFRWLISLIFNFLEPVVNLLGLNTVIGEFIATIFVFAAIIVMFFLAGLAVRSRTGNFFKTQLEKRYLMRIPGYRVARETVQQFFGSKKTFFSEVVLVDIFSSGALMTGFVTDRHGEFYTVFVPTGPNPTSGNIYHVHQDKVTHTSVPIDTGMKTIISCGAGSSDIFGGRIEQAAEQS